MARRRRRAGKPGGEGHRLAGLQDRGVGLESPVIEFVIAGIAQGDAHRLRHRQFARPVLTILPETASTTWPSSLSRLIVDLAEIDAAGIHLQAQAGIDAGRLRPDHRDVLAVAHRRKSRSAAPPTIRPTQPATTASLGPSGVRGCPAPRRAHRRGWSWRRPERGTGLGRRQPGVGGRGAASGGRHGCRRGCTTAPARTRLRPA